MTTLFNLFCPLMMKFSLTVSINLMILLTSFFSLLMMMNFHFNMNGKLSLSIAYSLFPSTSISLALFLTLFSSLSLLNLISLIVFSFPVTTTLVFNFSLAFIFWFISIIFLTMKPNFVSSLLPMNSPWYLVPFLSLVEMISISVRPITLCFRLLANMTAGHVLLSLICKLPFNTWLLGVLFGMLELLVSVVQAFVFTMLISVYFEEGVSH